MNRLLLLTGVLLLVVTSSSEALEPNVRQGSFDSQEWDRLLQYELGDPGLAERLLPLLEDQQADVRWNAALAVSRLGSDAGVAVLERMLDRRLTSAVPEITSEQQQESMISDIRALAAVRGAEAGPVLDNLADNDPSLKVRQAAIEARRALGL